MLKQTRPVLDRFHDSSKDNALCFMLYALCFMLYALCFMLYALCFMLYALCFMLYALCYVLCAHTRPHMPKPSSKNFTTFLLTTFCGGFLDEKCLQLFLALLTIFCGGFLDDFFTALLTIFYGFFCFAFYAVQISSPQYKSLITFFRGGV
jgi:hypothetical protein